MNKKTLEKKLIAPMIDCLTGNGIDLVQDYTEIALDSFLDQGLLKDVPVIGTALKLGQSVLSVRNLIMARNYYIFISDLRKEKKTDAELQRHIREFENKPKKIQKELELLLIYMDRYKEEEKAQYMANIYRAYLNNSVAGINWETAAAFFEILDRILLQDIRDLETVVKKGANKENFSDHSSLLRLSSLGVLQYFNGKEEKYGYNKKGLAKITSHVKLFYRVIKTGKGC